MSRLGSSPTTTFFERECLVRGLRMAGQWRFKRAVPNTLGAHIDQNAYEICYLADGSVDWWIEDKNYEVRRGQFYITKRGELHGAVDAVGHPSHLYWLQVVFPNRGALPGLTKDETKLLENRYAALRHRVFSASFAAAAYYETMLREMAEPTDHSPLIVRANMYSLLVNVLRDEASHETQHAQFDSPSARIQRALVWMEERLTEDYHIEQASAIAGLAISQFHKLFMQETGFTPADYRARQRIRRAKELLRVGTQPITEIGLSLGFSSSQYFASVFKKLTGMTPREYQQRTP